MPSCRDIDSLVTAYVDGETTPTQQAAVDAHLQACPPCRRRAEAEMAARQTLRSHVCRPCAPEHLRRRCTKVATPMGRLTTAYSPTQLSMFAAVVMILGGASVYGLTRTSSTVLAAQLTLDHIKCFAMHNSTAPVEAAASESQFAQTYGWSTHVPVAPPADGLQLVGVRRCFCGEGPAVHVMYRHLGEPVSLYVLPNITRPATYAEVFGHEAVVWSRRNNTYILVGRQSTATLQHLAMDLE